MKFLVIGVLMLLPVSMFGAGGDNRTLSTIVEEIYKAYTQYVGAVATSSEKNVLKSYYSIEYNKIIDRLEAGGKDMDKETKDRLIKEFLEQAAILKDITAYYVKLYDAFSCLALRGETTDNRWITVVLRYLEGEKQQKIDYIAVDFSSKRNPIITPEDAACKLIEPSEDEIKLIELTR